RTARCTPPTAANASAAHAAALLWSRSGWKSATARSTSKESTMADNDQQWERGLIEKLAMAALKEQRRARLWGIFWKLLTFAYLPVIILLAMDWKDSGEAAKTGRHTALVEIKGLIAPG